jgi:hypothetical protein
MPTQSFLALITPFDPSLKPDHTLPQPQPPLPGTPPPVVDNTLPGDMPRPSHPIYYPLPPNAPVDPGYGIPEEGLPHPDHTLPGPQPHPEHPIVLPPGGGGWAPVYIDNTLPTDPHPEHPIVIPPDGVAPPEAGGGKVVWKAIWTPANGWQLIGVVLPSGPVPTPSKK